MYTEEQILDSIDEEVAKADEIIEMTGDDSYLKYIYATNYFIVIALLKSIKAYLEDK